MTVTHEMTPADILRSADFDVVPYADRVEALAARLRMDLSATIFALRAVPLCLPRGPHAPARRTMASIIAEATPAVRAALPGLVADRLDGLRRPGRVDVMARIVSPLVSDVLAILSSAPIDLSGFHYLSRVFSQTMGPSRRRVMEAELRVVLGDLRAALPGADDAEIGLRLALLILGRDALLGTLAISLHHLFAMQRPFADLPFTEVPPRTGVPYIDRLAICPTHVDGHALSAGDIQRAWLRDYGEAKDPRARMAFFGAGAHLCLGRAISLDLWREIGAFVTALPGAVRVVECEMRHDDVFSVPETFVIEVDADAR